MVCCGLIAHLELARRPDLYGTPVIVGHWDDHVLAASDEAVASGVIPGIALRQAEHLCPTATFLMPDPEASGRLRELIAAALYDLAPIVEVRTEGVAWLDLEGVTSATESIREARRRLRAAARCEPRLGLGAGPFTSRLAAARARPGRLLRVDAARAFLAPLSSRELMLDAEQTERLDLLGLRTLGDVAAIGERELESQFADPVEDREALLFVARALCDDLAEELGVRGAAAKHVRVRLRLEGADEEASDSLVHHPLSSTAELFGLVGSWIKEWQPAAPIEEMWLELPVLEAAGRRQLRLWAGGDGTSEEVVAALERLQERFGEGVVTQVQVG